jgi:hypothetical protein
MKKIHQIGIAAAACVLLFACEKSDEGVRGEPLTLTGPTEKVVLLEANENETAVTFTWNNGIERNPTDTITYIFRIDIAGNNFATATPRDTVTDFTKSFTVGELNELITQQWSVYPGEEVLLEARVVANVRGEKFVYPEIATTAFSVVTYRVDDIASGVVGNYIGMLTIFDIPLDNTELSLQQENIHTVRLTTSVDLSSVPQIGVNVPIDIFMEVERDGEGYTLSGEGIAANGQVTVNGTVDADGNIELEIYVAALNTTATYTGGIDMGRVDDGESVGYKYLEDDFSWVAPFGGQSDVENFNATDNVALSTVNMYSTAAVAAGSIAAFTAHGYTDINPSAETIYFASHYLKFGRTDVQSGIQGSIPIASGRHTNVTLTFDATPCITGSKNYDDVLLIVEIDGPGAVDVDDKVTKRSAELDIQQVDKTTPWTWKTKSVVLYGITSATKITIKTNKSGAEKGTFRYYFDNLKFEKHSEVTP